MEIHFNTTRSMHVKNPVKERVKNVLFSHMFHMFFTTFHMHFTAMQYRSKVSYHHLARRVSFLERNETSLTRKETCLVSRECTGSTNTSHSSVFELRRLYRID